MKSITLALLAAASLLGAQDLKDAKAAAPEDEFAAWAAWAEASRA